MLLVSPAFADPPEKGFVGTLAYENGLPPSALPAIGSTSCAHFIETGDLFQMRSEFDGDSCARWESYGEPQCLIGRYGQVKVLEPPVFLGPIKNPIGNAKLFFWAVHVDNSPKGGTADYWVLSSNA